MGNDEELTRWVNERMSSLGPDTGLAPDLPSGWTRLHRQKRLATVRRIAPLAAVASVGLAMALPAPRAFAQRCFGACQTYFEAGAAPADGTAAHDFVLFDQSGRPVRLSDFRGRPVVLNFWATWCPPCRAEIPAFVELQDRFRNSGVVFLGVSIDENWDAVGPFVKEHNVNYPVILDNSAVAAAYGVTALPETFLIDRNGRVTMKHAGIVSKEQYEREIAALAK